MPRAAFTSLLLVAGLLVYGVVAADLERGVAAYRDGEFAAAIEELRGPAEQGDAEAQWLLGSAISNFQRPEKPTAEQWQEAMRWMQSAAAQGHVRAMLDVANLYMFYREPKDVASAAPWFLRAAERGNPEGQFWVGLLHFSGDAVPQDYVEAYKWWLLAARSGHPLARQMLEKSLDAITAEQTAAARQLADRWEPVK